LCTAVLVLRSPPRSMLFPYTTLFRSLIDCGEGTQLQLSRYGIKPSRIKHIFISHLHGDHYLGLVGLLSSMHLNGRREELFIYGPHSLKEIIDIHLLYSDTVLRYPIQFIPLVDDEERIIMENE